VIIEAILFLIFVIAIGAYIVKIVEWRHDVSFARYVKRNNNPDRR